MDNVKLTLV